jgi:hypothetical protein
LRALALFPGCPQETPEKMGGLFLTIPVIDQVIDLSIITVTFYKGKGI